MNRVGCRFHDLNNVANIGKYFLFQHGNEKYSLLNNSHEFKSPLLTCCNNIYVLNVFDLLNNI
jgi:hypothetical protein